MAQINTEKYWNDISDLRHSALEEITKVLEALPNKTYNTENNGFYIGGIDVYDIHLSDDSYVVVSDSDGEFLLGDRSIETILMVAEKLNKDLGN